MFLFIAILNGLAHFLYIHQLGFYEDDHFRVPGAMTMTAIELWNYITQSYLNFANTQGRPLHIISIYLGSFLGTKLAGLIGIYALVYLITTLTIFLFYKLLCRLQVDPIFSFSGTLFFVLFPADTTQNWITGVFGIYLSLTLLILAFHLYLSHRLWLSYCLITLSFLWYETVFWIFLVAPLFTLKSSSKLIKSLCKHFIFLSFIFVILFIIRKFSGESRITNLDLLEAFKISLNQSFLGCLTSLKTFFIAPVTTFKLLQSENLFYYLGTAILIIFFVTLSIPLVNQSKLSPKIPKLFGIALLMLLLSYPLSFTVSATVTQGVGTRIHLAGSLGASMMMACIFSVLFAFLRSYKQVKIGIVLLTFYFSLLVCSEILVQKDYQLNWQFQRNFWSQLIPLISDVESETLVFIEPQDFRLGATQQMRANDWNLPIILQQLYQFPIDWPSYPKVYLLTPNWKDEIITESNRFLLNTSTLAAAPVHLPVPNQDSTIDSQNVILIQTEQEKLVRHPQKLILHDQVFSLKEQTTTDLDSFPRKPLYNYLILDPLTESSYSTVR
ncbi:MAG: hypothetical protein AB4063_13045 [Crocosphaera sp.]